MKKDWLKFYGQIGGVTEADTEATTRRQARVKKYCIVCKNQISVARTNF
jgi:hypothetical protein